MTDVASSSRCSAAWQPPGRSRRARSSGQCRLSDFSMARHPDRLRIS